MMDIRKVTASEAREVMSALLNAPRVLGVEVVGSVARDRTGHDLDLVISVDPFIYPIYIREMTERRGNETDDYYDGFKATRREVAWKLLKLPPLVNAWLQCATRGLILDLHLMPEGWKEHIDEVQRHLPHDDPNFVRNIAKDAVVVRSVDAMGVKRADW